MLLVLVSGLKSWHSMKFNSYYRYALSFLFLFFSNLVFSQESAKQGIELSNSLSHQSGNLLQVALSLLVVIALIFVIAWFAKRLGGLNGMNTGLMSVKASLPLSPKEKLMVVQIGDEQVVVGVAPGFVGHIKTLDKPLLGETSTVPSLQATGSFSNTLQTLLNRQQKQHAETDSEKNG